MTKRINQSELNRLALQLHDLREALRPFAQFAEHFPPIILGSPRLTDSGPMLSSSPMRGPADTITFLHFREAKALLDRLELEDVARHVAQAEEQMSVVSCANSYWCIRHFSPNEPGAKYCTPHCEEEDAYWSALEDVDFSQCCGGNDREKRNHCTDCENYKEPP